MGRDRSILGGGECAIVQMPAKRRLRLNSVEVRSREDNYSEQSVVPGKQKLHAVKNSGTAVVEKIKKNNPPKRQWKVVDTDTDDKLLAALRFQIGFLWEKNAAVMRENTVQSMEIVRLEAILQVRDETIAKLSETRRHDSAPPKKSARLSSISE